MNNYKGLVLCWFRINEESNCFPLIATKYNASAAPQETQYSNLCSCRWITLERVTFVSQNITVTFISGEEQSWKGEENLKDKSTNK